MWNNFNYVSEKRNAPRSAYAAACWKLTTLPNNPDDAAFLNAAFLAS